MIKPTVYSCDTLGRCGYSYKISETENLEKDGWFAGAELSNGEIHLWRIAGRGIGDKQFCSFECFSKWAEAQISPTILPAASEEDSK